MWWENKLMRMVRCRLQQKPGVLGRLLSTVGDAGGFLGEIRTVRMGSTMIVRDIVVFADDKSHMNRLIQIVRETPDVELIEVRDEVLEMHQRKKFLSKAAIGSILWDSCAESTPLAWLRFARRSRRYR